MLVFLCIIGVVAIVGFCISLNAKGDLKLNPCISCLQTRTTSPSQLYWEYPIVGMKYRKLSHEELESFYRGTLKHDKKNKSDSLAIGVYNERGRCVGYISTPDNEEIFEAMQDAGIDEVDVIGSIEKSYDYGYMAWVGRIYIKKEVLNLPEP